MVLEADTKVTLDRTAEAGKYHRGYDRHRLLALDSVELLILSGDVRCFRILDPPLAAFCATLMRPRLSAARRVGAAGAGAGAGGADVRDPLRGNMSMAPNTQLDPQG